MITGLLTFVIGAAVLLYMGGVLWLATMVQDWAVARGYPDVLLPWLFTIIFAVFAPVSLFVAVVMS